MPLGTRPRPTHAHRAIHLRQEALERRHPSGPRALPSGPALNPTGFAIALFLLGAVALLLGFGFIAWLAWSFVASIRNFVTGK